MPVYTNAGGGSGLDTDELTAAAADVLKGKTAGVRGSDEPAAGTLELTGDAADSTVLAGKTYYNVNAKTKRTGTMANQGAKTAALNSGGSYTIPTGYHNGAGKVTANSLASQTGGATAEDKYVYNGKTYWKDGVKRTGNMAVSPAASFSVAAYSATQFTCTWKWPSNGPYSGVIIRGKLGGYPGNISDGQLFYQGTGNNAALGGSSSVIIGGAQEGSSGTAYYFRIWVYCTCSAGNMYSGYLQAAASTKARGQQIFTSSGTFTVPANTTCIDIFCVGGGGGGGQNNASTTYDKGGCGGGAGYTRTKIHASVISGQTYAVTIGAGAAGGNSNTNNSKKTWNQVSRGGSSSLGSLCFSRGGFTAQSSSTAYYDAGSPGSGGSAGGASVEGNTIGCSDGENAYSSNGYILDQDAMENEANVYNIKNYGQGITTRAFEESNGTLYSGGGGGGGWYNKSGNQGYWYGNGGVGGGGHGGEKVNNIEPTPGDANTGGGGGGAGTRKGVGTTGSASGGSGIVIVRWGY
ncbi:glycine-rich domain-containing protein [Clostridium sp. AM58-1XD]|uniref:glycine-rich domain-containing protein n=1 Tax=Clostridium sp. AM58-1XD TaxID=2292307 RepID=UPI000E54F1F0|nr:hypothetical protein [Clostridium sp. AM58-1XD]RGY98418.1 hypothetical protein DXA13_11520 [Clostridium sp. AM58-1XD]